MNRRELDIKTLVMVKSYDLMKERIPKINISFQEMFDNNLIIERLAAKGDLTPNETFLIDVINMSNVCKNSDKDLFARCSAIIETLVVLNLDSQLSVDSAVQKTLKELSD